MAAGEDVTFVGFGSFKRKERGARKGRNPKTGAELNIPAKKAVSFTAGKSLKEAVSGIVTPPKPKAAPKSAPKAKSASAVPAQPKPTLAAPSKAKSATSAPATPKPVVAAPKAPVSKAAPKKA